MKKQLLIFTAILAVSFTTNAQSILNGDFENWTTTPYDYLNFYRSSSLSAIRLTGSNNCTKETDAYHGNFALKLETKTNGQDTMFGYIINGDPENGQGGIPYNQGYPTSITGYYKSNIPVGDTALFIVMFKSGGQVLGGPITHKFYGTHSTYTQFSIPFPVAPTVIVDSIIIGAVSSDAFRFNGIPGSMLQLDSIRFNGVPNQPSFLNGDFESWTATNSIALNDWNSFSSEDDTTSIRTTDAYKGMYACKLGMSAHNNGTVTEVYGAQIESAKRPFTQISDSIIGYYKLLTNVNDSAVVYASTYLNGSIVGGAYKQLPQASGYTRFAVAVLSMSAPDSIRISVQASDYPSTLAEMGTVLYIDEVQIKSQPLTTSLFKYSFDKKLHIYPNPSEGQFTVSYNKAGVTADVYNAIGELVHSDLFNYQTTIDLSNLAKGIYSVVIKDGASLQTRKVIVK